MKLQYDGTRSNLAFNFNLRPYNVAPEPEPEPPVRHRPRRRSRQPRSSSGGTTLAAVVVRRDRHGGGGGNGERGGRGRDSGDGGGGGQGGGGTEDGDSGGGGGRGAGVGDVDDGGDGGGGTDGEAKVDGSSRDMDAEAGPSCRPRPVSGRRRVQVPGGGGGDGGDGGGDSWDGGEDGGCGDGGGGVGGGRGEDGGGAEGDPRAGDDDAGDGDGSSADVDDEAGPSCRQPSGDCAFWASSPFWASSQPISTRPSGIRTGSASPQSPRGISAPVTHGMTDRVPPPPAPPVPTAVPEPRMSALSPRGPVHKLNTVFLDGGALGQAGCSRSAGQPRAHSALLGRVACAHVGETETRPRAGGGTRLLPW